MTPRWSTFPTTCRRTTRLAGALQLGAAPTATFRQARFFPSSSIPAWAPAARHCRRLGDYKFVAPDNGVLSLVMDEHPPKRVVELTERKYARPTVSRTFEGRDRFAPAAAWLANGVDLGALGPAAGALHRLAMPKPTVESESGTVLGQVLRVDRFGNLITNIDRRTFDAVMMPGGDALEVHVGGHQVQRVVSTYADAGPGEICALFGSTDHLEIAANGASAAELLDLGRGAAVRLVPRA